MRRFPEIRGKESRNDKWGALFDGWFPTAFVRLRAQTVVLQQVSQAHRVWLSDVIL